MKKCASCTKDLPDAALHCVFCGAKQPPAPAVAGSVAKTVMGHGNPEMIEQLRAQAAAAAARPAPSNLPAAAPYSAPQPQPARPQPAAPAASAVAPTMFVPGGPGGGPMPGGPGASPMSGPPMGGPIGGPSPLGPGPGPMGPGPMGPGPMGPGPMGPGPMGPGPIPAPNLGPAPIPATPPYLASKTASRAGRPIEPWKDSLRLMMFIWGGALIAAFMTPVATSPDIQFWFNVIIDGDGIEKLLPLLMVGVGLLSVVLAAVPTSPMPRGLIAGILGFAGIVVPELLLLSKGEFGLGQILELVELVGVLALVPGLLLRSEYRDSIMPRIMVTVGVLCVLVTMLIPQNDSIPLVEAFKTIIDAPGKAKVSAILALGPVLLAVLSLLVWLPAPSSGGAKVFAWLWICWGAVVLYTALLVDGEIGAVVANSPYLALVAWVAGVGGKIVGAAYLALTGFGFATVFGKQLE